MFYVFCSTVSILFLLFDEGFVVVASAIVLDFVLIKYLYGMFESVHEQLLNDVECFSFICFC